MSKTRHSLSSKLSLSVIITSAVLLMVAILVLIEMSSSLLRKAAIDDTRKTLECSLNKLEADMSEVQGQVDGAAWMVEYLRDDPKKVLAFNREFLVNNPSIYGTAVAFEPWYFNSEGKYFMAYSCRTPKGVSTSRVGSEDYHYFSMEWYQLPVLTKSSGWSEPYFDEGAGNDLMSTYSVPLTDDFGQIYAVMTADITLDTIVNTVSKVKPFENSQTFLVSNTGLFISHPDSTKCCNETIFASALSLENKQLQDAARKMMRGENGYANFTSSSGNRCFMVYSHMSNGWGLCTVVYERDVLAITRESNLVMIAILLLGLVILFFATKHIIKRQTKPLTEFSDAAMQIAGGDFSAPLPSQTSITELDTLHDSMEYMMKSINDYIVKLGETTAAKQKIESELQIASAIQLAMVPHEFDTAGLADIFADVHPAKEVGGDLYDFTIQGKNLYFVVGDVSGKGVPAALFMAICCAAFRLVSALGLSVDGIVSKINDICSKRNESNMFTTMFVGKIDLDTLEMEYCNAGHNPIIIIAPDGSARYIHAKANLAIGLFPDFPYQKESIKIEKGSRILVYTDGVSEAENAAKELYGEDRLLEFAGSEPAQTDSRQFAADLLANVRSFTLGNPQNDDITMMSIKL
ncbi:MAG: SpoIIE family protein phosphatase [Bacteroidales bacterium]|nr:SpoIIE family protein phosphatase [Bacteroidales bacterium]